MTKDMTGQRCGLWLVLEEAPPARTGGARWRCRCVGCGDVHVVRGDALRAGKTLGCASCRAPRARASIEVRRQVAAAHRAGKSIRQIATSLGVSTSFVNDVLDSPASALRVTTSTEASWQPG